MQTDKENHALKGPVKTVQEESAEYKEQDGQVVEEPSHYRYTLTFNRNGNLVETAHRNPDGTWRTLNDYSDDGKLLRSRAYDSLGGLSPEVRYIYDAQQRVSVAQTVNKDGKVTRAITYSYDAENRKTKTETLDVPGDVSIGLSGQMWVNAPFAKQVVTRYDEHDAESQVTVYNAEGALVRRLESKRDARGKVLEERQYLGDVPPFSVSPPSSSPGEQITLSEEQKAEIDAEIRRRFPPGMVMNSVIYRYDDEGRLIEKKARMMGRGLSFFIRTPMTGTVTKLKRATTTRKANSDARRSLRMSTTGTATGPSRPSQFKRPKVPRPPAFQRRTTWLAASSPTIDPPGSTLPYSFSVPSSLLSSRSKVPSGR